MPYEAAKLRAAVREFAYSAAVPVFLDGERCEAPPQKPAADNQTFNFFDRDTSIELRLRGSFHGSLMLYYRGAPLERNRSWALLDLEADLRFGDARDLLQLSREKLSRNGVEVVEQRLEEALSRAVPAYVRQLQKRNHVGPELQAASLWLLLADGPESHKLSQSVDAWKKHTLWEGGPALGTLVEARTLDVVVDEARRSYKVEPNKWSHKTGVLEILSRTSLEPETLLALLSKMGRHVSLQHGERRELDGLPGAGQSRVVYRITSDPLEDPLPDAGLKFLLLHRHSSWGVGGRISLPCSDRFGELALRDRATWGTWIRSTENFTSRLMVSPFFVEGHRRRDRFTLRNIGQLIRWVVPRLLNPVPAERVAAAYLRFIEHAHKLVHKEWGSRVGYSIDEVRHELRREFGLQVLDKSELAEKSKAAKVEPVASEVASKKTSALKPRRSLTHDPSQKRKRRPKRKQS